MSLRLQIETIIFSFLFGFLAFFIRMLFYKQIYNKNKFIKIIFSFLYIEMLTLIYIKGLIEINNLILHFYSYFFVLLGFFLPFIYLKHCKH